MLGLLGASVIFVFHEFTQEQVRKLATHIKLLNSQSVYSLLLIVFLDLLIAAPMIPPDEYSQIYTAILVGSMMYFMLAWCMHRLYVYVSRKIRPPMEEEEEIRQRVQKRNERLKRDFRNRMEPASNETIEYFEDIFDKISILREKALISNRHTPAQVVYLTGVGFLVSGTIIFVSRLFTLISQENVPIGVRLTIILLLATLSAIFALNQFMEYREEIYNNAIVRKIANT